RSSQEIFQLLGSGHEECSMESINPYASPQTSGRGPVEARCSNGAWRSGKLLVVFGDAELPNRCVKCNALIDDRRVYLKLSWHARWIYYGLLFGILPYLMLRAVLRKRWGIYVSVCEKHRRLSFYANLFGIVGSLGGLFLIVFRPGYRPASSEQIL